MFLRIIMRMDNDGFLNRLRDIVTDKIYIGSARSELSQEIRTNMWCISATQKECMETRKEDLISFINEVISNRRNQVRNSYSQHGMIFYLWFDEQAIQLRFNLISDFHEHLPFECSMRLVDQPNSVIEAFLQFPYHDGIPMVELRGVDLDDVIAESGVKLSSHEISNDDYVLDVYRVDLPKTI